MPQINERVKVSDLLDIQGIYIYLKDFKPLMGGAIGEGTVASINGNPSFEELGLNKQDLYCVYNPVESDDNLDFED
ncbi:MAG: hypothetical protein IJV15_13275 [Lachnospiraceae bacterium]|nr:hypothetical protein [Lachnospiraceae bacterium]MBR1598950.1 hypothetical protein [Lachnospiraceae bacterium]